MNSIREVQSSALEVEMQLKATLLVQPIQKRTSSSRYPKRPSLPFRVNRSHHGETLHVAEIEVAAVVSGHVRQEGAQGHFYPLERPRSLGSGQVEAIGFLNELG